MTSLNSNKPIKDDSTRLAEADPLEIIGAAGEAEGTEGSIALTS